MSALQINSAEIFNTLKKAGIDEDQYQWTGFITGAVAKGISPGGSDLSRHISDILNNKTPLSGILSAFFTTLAIKVQKELDNDSGDFFFLPQEGNDLQTLTALSDLCAGLCLGLSLSPDQGVVSKITSPELADFIKTLGSIADVDTQGPTDPEDLKAVVDYMSSQLRLIYRKR